DLQRLHQAYWTARGKPGAFANPVFTVFHTRLIREALSRKEVEIARISSEKGVIGYLYQFRKNGRVYSYQSGFHYEDDNRLKPGLVSHRLAIEHSLSAGDAVYDFLAGDDRYKRSLGTDAGQLFWLTLQKRRLAFFLERGLRAAKRLALGIRKTPDIAAAP
ncbi:MAG: GNAT family N-acetyltransferase, partial [Allosphingosinicella sp.]